jgi:phage terminase large subunit-like protein
VRVVVSVDPSGASDDEQNADNDEVGITVDALGTDGRGLPPRGPDGQGRPGHVGQGGGAGVHATQGRRRGRRDELRRRHGQETIQVAAKALGTRVPFKMVTASRGKVQRAEPFSALYEEGKVRHVGIFAKLEDEMCAFSTGGYTGPRSPNRADAHIWGLAELFPAIVRPPAPAKAEAPIPMVSPFGRR